MNKYVQINSSFLYFCFNNILENAKDVSFIMKLILDDIYANSGLNAKYIPVLLPKSKEDHVPFVLRGSTIYRAVDDFQDLLRRVFKVEKYKIALS